MHKMSGKYLKKNTKLAWKVFFLFPCIIFKVNFQLWGSEMPSCNRTPYQWCVYWSLNLCEDLREGLKINKRASVRLYWLFNFDCLSASKVSSFGLSTGFCTKGRPLVKSNLICLSDKLSWPPGCPVFNINIQGNFCISQRNGSSDNQQENLV